MTISLKARVKKVTEDDILFEVPEPSAQEATWVWRRVGFRCADIMDVMVLDKKHTILTIWDNRTDEPKKIVVREPFDDVMLKWEIAQAENAVFEPDGEDEEEPSENSSEEEDD